MNRWKDKYDSFNSSGWEQIIKFSAAINLRTVTEPDLKIELARFRKLTNFLSDHFKAIEPEIVPLQVWDGINNNANHCVNHLHNDLSNMVNANNYLDQIIGLIRPYMTSNKDSAQAASHAFRAYNEIISEAITATTEASNLALEAIEENQKSIEAFATKLLGNEKQDNDGDDEYADEDEENPSIKSKILSLYEKFNTHVEKTEEFYERLTKGDTEKNALIKDITDAQKHALKSKSEIEDAWERIVEHLKHIGDFHKKVYGEQDPEGNFIGGLQKETDERIAKLDEFGTEQTDVIEKLKEQIEGLLPGATSAGLASAYKDLKDDATKKEARYKWGFALTVIALGVYMAWSLSQIETATLEQWLVGLLYSAPVITSALWLAFFFSKRRSEHHRLEQEYAHKEALAKSYDSYKTQINALQSTDEALLIRLLETAIKAIGNNPANTLDKKHGDNAPIVDVGEMAVKTVKDVTKDGF